MGVVLGLAVVAALGWIALIVGRRVVADDRRRAAADALASAERVRAGGAAERPVEVESPAQIEPRVEREPCLRCGGRMHVDAHEVDDRGPELLRRVVAVCGGCGARGTTWFRVRVPLTH